MSVGTGPETGKPKADVGTSSDGNDALYPPTVTPPAAPLPLPLFLLRFVKNPLLSLPRPVYEEPIVLSRPRDGAPVWVTGPALVERILLHEADSFPKSPLERRVLEAMLGDGIRTAQGASWRWQRRTAAPLFRHQDLLAHVPVIARVGEDKLKAWLKGGGEKLHRIEREMAGVTYDVFSQTLLHGAARADGEAIQSNGAVFLSRSSWEVAAGMVGLPAWVWHPAKSTLRRTSRELRAATKRIIAARRAAEREPGRDILGRLLAARDPETGAPMTDEQVTDNLLTFIAAGHETTAKALTWTLYLLSRSPSLQDRVREEVEAVCGSGTIAARHIEGLRITQRVLKESMRLYPPAPVMTRVTARDLDLGGHRLRAGTLIVIPIFAIHRHRQLWDDPDRFDPDRFLPEAESHHLRTQFMPFGFGPRTCIGMSFAMIEATVLLATFVRGVRIGWDGKHLPQPVSRVTLQPKGGMPLLLSPVSRI